MLTFYTDHGGTQCGYHNKDFYRGWVPLPEESVSWLFLKTLTFEPGYSAAENFVEAYYTALRSSRASLSSFYSAPSAMPDGKPLPAIVFNGNVIPDAPEFQNMFEKQMPPAHYEIQSYDCHVLNPNYAADGVEASSGGSGKNMSIMLMVSGYVKFGELRDAEMRGFSETFVLIPTPGTTTSKERGKRGNQWLIQCQNFRLVV